MFKLSSAVLIALLFQGKICIGVPTSKQELVHREEKSIKHVLISSVDEGKDEKTFQRIECPYPYVNVAERCLYAVCDPTSNVYSWTSSRSFCNGIKQGDLATFETACELDDIASYLRSIPSGSGCSYWVGGSDIAPPDGNWTWINGELMPRGVPIWVNSGATVGPTATSVGGPNYAQIQISTYRLVNVADTATATYAPLCEYKPQKIDLKNSIKTIPSYYDVPSGSYGAYKDIH